MKAQLVFVAFLKLFDVLVTFYGLYIGYFECNPVYRFLMDTLGWWVFPVLNLIILAFIFYVVIPSLSTLEIKRKRTILVCLSFVILLFFAGYANYFYVIGNLKTINLGIDPSLICPPGSSFYLHLFGKNFILYVYR